LIGFTKCGEVEFPSDLKSRKITNPDAPRNDHAIQIRVGGEEVRAVPILFSNARNMMSIAAASSSIIYN
jgi:hypothetical protein